MDWDGCCHHLEGGNEYYTKEMMFIMEGWSECGHIRGGRRKAVPKASALEAEGDDAIN